MKFQRNCPKCESILEYSSKATLNKAERQNLLCRTCGRRPRGTSERLKCPDCIYTFYRESELEKHLNSSHNVTDMLAAYFRLHNLTSPQLCKCGCNQETKWNGWRKGYADFVPGHNGNIYNVYDAEIAKSISDKRKELLTGQVGWSRGLSKETDERIAKRSSKISEGLRKSVANGTYFTWRKGKTKETDERIAKDAEKQREAFAIGKRIPWSKGLTKLTDARLANLSASVKQSCNNPELRQYLDTLKRVDPETIASRVVATGWKMIIDDDHPNTNINQIQVQCETCQTKFVRHLGQLEIGFKCKTCFPRASKAQLEIEDFITKQLGISVERETRKIISPKELDIYIPSHMVAIEYNGLYWHSGDDCKTIHQEKSNMCRVKGINLIHIFEDDWRDKRSIVESIISRKLGITTTSSSHELVIGIDKNICLDFLRENDIHGACDFQGSIGLKNATGKLDAIAVWDMPNDTTCVVKRLCPRNNISPDTYVKRLLSSIEHVTGCQKISISIDTNYFSGTCFLTHGYKQTSRECQSWLTDSYYRYKENELDPEISQLLEPIYGSELVTFEKAII